MLVRHLVWEDICSQCTKTFVTHTRKRWTQIGNTWRCIVLQPVYNSCKLPLSQVVLRLEVMCTLKSFLLYIEGEINVFHFEFHIYTMVLFCCFHTWILLHTHYGHIYFTKSVDKSSGNKDIIYYSWEFLQKTALSWIIQGYPYAGGNSVVI